MITATVRYKLPRHIDAAARTSTRSLPGSGRRRV